MKNSKHIKAISIVFSLNMFLFGPASFGADWPIWGRDGSRNMVSSETGLIVDFKPGEVNDDEVVDMKTTKNVKLRTCSFDRFFVRPVQTCLVGAENTSSF